MHRIFTGASAEESSLRDHAFHLNTFAGNCRKSPAQLKPFIDGTGHGKKIFLFANLHYWIEHATLLGSALAGLGHRVTLGYLPYSDWQKPVHDFDLRRQNLYARKILAGAGQYMKAISLLDIPPEKTKLPPALEAEVREVSIFDSQYTLQVEQIAPTEPVFLMRQERNHLAAAAAYSWLKKNPQDVVIVPNGTIQELGVVYRVARHLKIPAITYEFGEQTRTNLAWAKFRDHAPGYGCAMEIAQETAA